MATKKKPVRKSTKKGDNKAIYIGLGVVGLGAAMALLNPASAAKIRTEPGGSTPAKTPTGTKPATGTTTAVTPKIPVPAGDSSNGLYRDTAKNHVFIDSFDGESIWGGIDTSRWASMAVTDNIAKVHNKAYIGKLTGRTHSQSLWDWVEVGSYVDGVLRKYWVDKKEVKLLSEAEKNSYLKGGGGEPLSDFHLAAMRRYYNK